MADNKQGVIVEQTFPVDNGYSFKPINEDDEEKDTNKEEK